MSVTSIVFLVKEGARRTEKWLSTKNTACTILLLGQEARSKQVLKAIFYLSFLFYSSTSTLANFFFTSLLVAGCKKKDAFACFSKVSSETPEHEGYEALIVWSIYPRQMHSSSEQTWPLGQRVLRRRALNPWVLSRALSILSSPSSSSRAITAEKNTSLPLLYILVLWPEEPLMNRRKSAYISLEPHLLLFQFSYEDTEAKRIWDIYLRLHS